MAQFLGNKGCSIQCLTFFIFTSMEDSFLFRVCVYLNRSLQSHMPFSLYLERWLTVFSNFYVAILGLKSGKSSCRVREEEFSPL